MVMKPSLFMFVAVGAVVVCLLQLHQVVAKGGQTSDTAGATSGDIECPCFCSERSSDFSGYYDSVWDAPPDGPIQCATPCQTDTSRMTACAGIVNYRFCPRLLEQNQNISTADQLIDEYNVEARDCYATTKWEKDDEESDCLTSVRRGACYLLFPQCHPETDEPQRVCHSVCVNERVACRQLNSNFGAMDQINGECSALNWHPATGPSDQCTGAASPIVASRLLPAAAALALALLSLLIAV